MSAIAIKEMKTNEITWQKYYNDFVYYYLHLSANPDSIEHKLLQKTLFKNYNEMKAIAAHCYMYLYQLDLARMVASLKSLGQLQVLNEGQESGGEGSSLVDTLETSKDDTNSSISKFVIKSLFAALIKAICSKDSKSKLRILQQWFNSYRDMVSPCINAS